MRRTLVAAVAVLAGGVLAGCSSAVPQEDVEEQISTLISDELGVEPGDVSCPEDLNAEKGQEMTCTTEVEGIEYDVEVVVKSVEGDTANYEIELVEQKA